MFRLTLPLVSLALFVACAAAEDVTLDRDDFADGFEGDEPSAGAFDGNTTFRFDVFPGYSVTSADAETSSLLPHTFEHSYSDGRLDLVLQHPVHLEGEVTAYRVGPVARSADLPGYDEPLQGTFSVRRDDTVQGRTVALDSNGRFAVDVVPREGYRLAVIPTDPALPTWTGEQDLLGDQVLDLDIGAGSALWGQVIDATGLGLSGVTVQAVSAFGPKTPQTTTDSEGYFVLRVSPGSWRVHALGRGNGRDPSLRTELIYVDEDGAAVEIAYANLVSYNVGGRMEPGTGPGIRDGMARFTATALEDYPDTAELVVEARADAFGNFDTRLLAGRYHVELFPVDDQELTPLDLGEVRITGPTDLGALTLPVAAEVRGLVVDPEGIVVAGALIDCAEDGFAERSFSAYTDEAGTFEMIAPRVPLRCDLVPPGDRSDMALTRRVLDPGENEAPLLSFVRGVLFDGTVRYDDDGALRALELGVIEVRDAKGQLLGTALTGVGDGEFALRIDPSAE